MTGESWFSGFMKRHPSLPIRSPEPTSIARTQAFNKHNVNLFYDNIEKAINTTQINSGSRVIRFLLNDFSE